MADERSVPPPRHAPAVLGVLGIALAAAAFSAFYIGQRYWLDDSFISFRYAKNLIAGHGLVYNPGDPVEGYTNFLWTLVAAAGISLRIDPILFTQGASLLCQALTLGCLYEIGRSGGRVRWQPALAPLLLAGSVSFLAYPMTGMETSAFTMLYTASFLLLVRGAHASLAGGLLTGACLLALGTTRFDGFVPVVLLLSYPLLFDRARSLGARLRRLRVVLMVLAFGFGAYNLWRLSFYGLPLPNTFYAKTGFSIGRGLAGLAYLREFALGQGTLLLFVGALPFAFLRATPIARHAGWVVLGQLGYAAVVGGDWMPHHRFVLPVLPLLCFLMQEGWCLAAEGLAQRSRAPRFGGAVAVVLAFGFQLVPLLRSLDFSDLSGPHFRPHDARRIGRYLSENLPPDRTIAIEWGGIIPFYTEHETLDTYGLTDREIVAARVEGADGREVDRFPKTIWGRRVDPAYLAERAPDLVVPNARLMPTREAAFESLQPGGPNRYSYYHELFGETHGYKWSLFEVGRNAWWAALVRRDDQ